MLSKKNSMVTMVTDEFQENRIILQKSVATIEFIWFFWFQKCIRLYIFVQVFVVRRRIRSHISFFRLGLTPTLTYHTIIFHLLATVRQKVIHYLKMDNNPWRGGGGEHSHWKVFWVYAAPKTPFSSHFIAPEAHHFNSNLPNPINFIPFDRMRYSHFDINLLNIHEHNLHMIFILCFVLFCFVFFPE